MGKYPIQLYIAIVCAILFIIELDVLILNNCLFKVKKQQNIRNKKKKKKEKGSKTKEIERKKKGKKNKYNQTKYKKITLTNLKYNIFTGIIVL